MESFSCYQETKVKKADALKEAKKSVAKLPNKASSRPNKLKKPVAKKLTEKKAAIS